jgi:hypothetical protein
MYVYTGAFHQLEDYKGLHMRVFVQHIGVPHALRARWAIQDVRDAI